MAIYWWWLLVGAALMLGEIVTPGFVMFFFGLGSLATGLLLVAFPEMPMWGQALFFSVSSVVGLLFLRRYVTAFFGIKEDSSRSEIDDGFSGKIARVTVAISPTVPGRVMLGDAEWSAVSDSFMDKGVDVRIVSRANLTLKVEKI